MHSDKPIPIIEKSYNETLPPRSSLRAVAAHPATKITTWVIVIEVVLAVLRTLERYL